MSPADFDPRMHQQMGEVLAEIRNLRDAFRQAELKSDTSRAAMHSRMDQLVDRIGKVEGGVAAVQEDVTEMKPVTDEVKRWKLMGMGALAVTGRLTGCVLMHDLPPTWQWLEPYYFGRKATRSPHGAGHEGAATWTVSGERFPHETHYGSIQH